MRALDLFAGIGLFSIGMHRAGIETVAACELAEWKRLILAEMVPCPQWADIRDLSGQEVIEHVGSIELVFGSPPCTEFSSANAAGRGLDGDDLFFEALRVVNEIRPRWFVFENSPNVRTRGADRILGEVDRSGYACWPVVVGADNAGAPHRRKRVFLYGMRRDLVADANGERGRSSPRGDHLGSKPGPKTKAQERRSVANPDTPGIRQQPRRGSGQNGQGAAEPCGAHVANPHGNGRQHGGGRGLGRDVSAQEAVSADSESERRSRGSAAEAGRWQGRESDGSACHTPDANGQGLAFWESLAPDHGPQLAVLERDLGPAIHDWAGGLGGYLRLANGCPARTARMLMSACGDAVVVEVAEEIGKAVMQKDRQWTR